MGAQGPGEFRATLLSQQGQGQGEPGWRCEGRRRMEMWNRQAWSCPQVNGVSIGKRESLMNTAPGLLGSFRSQECASSSKPVPMAELQPHGTVEEP